MMLVGMPLALTEEGTSALHKWIIPRFLEAVTSESLGSLPRAQANPSHFLPLVAVVGVLVSTLFGGWVLDEEGFTTSPFGGLGVLGVLVGCGVELEGLGLHRLEPRFFLAIPWWFGSCLAKWSGWIERARVWDGAKVQRRVASVDSARMLRRLMAGIFFKGR